jgi:cell division protein FtsB
MAWLKKKTDPLSAQARALSDQIAALESQIKKLDSQLQSGGPKLRSTTLPSGATAPVPPPVAIREPVFEKVDQRPIQMPEAPPAPEMINEFGGRKIDLPALWNRLHTYWRGPTTSNPRLVSYLAAGGFHGLRPMRREKRVARNRFLGLVAVLFIVLFLIVWHYLKNR